MRCKVHFLHVVIHGNLLYLFGLVRHAWACVLQNNKLPISLGKVELFCLFVACSYTFREATVFSCCFGWVCSNMPKVIWNNKSPISLERVEWFCWFFACSYLHLVGHPLKLPQPIRLSDVLNLKKLKTIWGFKLIVCLHWSYKKYAISGYAAKYSWCISWRIFYFWLVWLVNLNTGGSIVTLYLFILSFLCIYVQYFFDVVTNKT